MFGHWTDSLATLQTEFQNNIPYEHIVLDNFFEESYAEHLYSNFPTLSSGKWFVYNNPIEYKYAMNMFSTAPVYADLFENLQSANTLSLIQSLTGYTDLEIDPNLHGAGVHYHPRGGKLDMHLDYSIHPISGKERRVNLIVYMNKDWKEEYNGSIELWDSEFTTPVKKIAPHFNRAILFRTSDISYHGMPKPLECPEEIGRKSIAIYYVSNPRETANHRYKAQYRALPWQPVDARLQMLYDIRVKRILTNEDLDTIYPNWKMDGNGFW